MDSSVSEGLGVSILIYMGAILVPLMLLGLPLYFAIAPTVYENPPLVRSDTLLMNGPIVGRRVSTTTPLAFLKREILVDPATLAALKLNAKPQRSSNKVARRPTGTTVAELQPERHRRPFFLFSWF